MANIQAGVMGARCFSSSQNIIAAILIILAISIAWLGSFDKAAGDYIDVSIKNAAITYGIARGINAVVSLIQSVEVSVVIASVNFGELLDPINDIIERFSEMMTYAIISLSLQKILLEIVEHNIFNILLTISGLSLLLQLFVADNRYVTLTLKTFLTLVFIRLSLSLVLMLNMSVDSFFIADKIIIEQASVKKIEHKLDNIYSVVKGDKSDADDSLITTPATGTKISEIELHIEELSKKKESIHAQVAEQEALISNQKIEAEKIREMIGGWFDQLTTDSPALTLAEQKVDNLREELDKLEMSDYEIDANISNDEAAIECAQKRSRGETCSMTEKWENIKQKMSIKSTIAKLERNSEKWFSSVLTLLTLMLLKSILLPLLFWYAILKGIKKLWSSEWAMRPLAKIPDS